MTKTLWKEKHKAAKQINEVIFKLVKLEKDMCQATTCQDTADYIREVVLYLNLLADNIEGVARKSQVKNKNVREIYRRASQSSYKTGENQHGNNTRSSTGI